MGSQPYEIVYGPANIYLAAVGTTFPTVDATPGAGWFKLGTDGDKNFAESGVKIGFNQTINEWKGLGSTGARKVTRISEAFKVSGEIADLTPAQLAKFLNDVTVSTVAAASGQIGTKSITLHQGVTVTLFALVVRFESPEGLWNGQLQVPRVYHSGNPGFTLEKANPALAAFEFTAIEDITAVSDDMFYGEYIEQNADALP